MIPCTGKVFILDFLGGIFSGQLKESQKKLKTNITIEENIKNPQLSDYIHQWKILNQKIQDSIDRDNDRKRRFI